MPRRILLGAASALMILAASPVAAQTVATRLSLRDALRIADSRSYANRGAAAVTDAAHAQANGAMRGILPSVSTEAGVIRTTDPIGAFGFALKQRSVSAASFAPALLNDPAGITNFGTALVFEQPLVNADAWMGLKSARAAADAAASGARWTATSVHGNVVQAYFGAIVAGELASAMREAERSALEHVRSAELALANGFVTRSDVLLARVRAGDVTAQRLEAESRLRLARASLATLLGVPADTAVSLPESVPSPSDVISLIAQPAAAGAREDVLAARGAQRAAQLDLRRSQGSLLPRINGFARYDWNSPSRFGGGSPAWTAGAVASWSVFGGGRELADMSGAAARLRGAEAQAEGAEAAADLDRRAADEALSVAIARAAIADTAVLQSSEALRIVRRKYDGGLSVVSELLDAAAAETTAHVMRARSRFDVLVAAADRLRAWGADPAALAALDIDLR